MDFSNEIVPLGGVNKDGIPIKGNADKTVHQGIEFSLACQPFRYLDVNANLAWSENQYKSFLQQNYSGGTDDLSGNTIAGFPGLIGNLNLSAYWGNLRSSLFVKHVGKQYLDNTQNEERIIDPFTRFDLMLDYRIKTLRFFPEIRLLFKVYNLLGKEYETAGYYDSWADVAYYYPAAGRNYYVSVGFSF
jgi:iron complex outermembrane receptor protein